MRILALIFLIPSIVQAGIYITVSGANVRKAKLALGQVHALADTQAVDTELADKVAEQVKSDLEFANLFEFINPASYAQWDQKKDFYSVSYPDFSNLQAAFLLKLGYKINSGKLILEALFYDVPGQKKIFGTRYQFPATQYQRLVHALTEDVLREITGEKGLFNSRIVMSCRDTRRRRSPPKEIYISDADGRNFKPLTSDETLSLSPSWSPDGKYIAYTQFEYRLYGGVRKKGTVVKRHDLMTGTRTVLSAKEGMNSGSAWSPDGKRMALTLSMTGRPEIYLMNPFEPGSMEPLSRTIQWRKIGSEGYQSNAENLLFDVEPSWSPDGKKLVISSARTGHPMIYVIDLASKAATQLTFAGTYNASPAWSPKGDRIVFAAQRLAEGNFDLYLIDPDGNNLNRLTVGDRVGARRVNSENPSWAPTGRHLTFASSEGGTYGIYTMTADGAVRRKISPPDKECMSPAWGPPEG